MNKPVIIYGGGGHAAVLIDTLRLLGREILGIVDDDPAATGREVLGVAVLGGNMVIAEHDPDAIELVNAIGSIRAVTDRAERFDAMTRGGYTFATVVHPAAVVAASATLGHGVQVLAGAIIQSLANVGDNTLVNTRASIDHHCVIGPHCHIAPGATLSGSVTVGRATHVGVGAIIKQTLTIGRDATVGAGAVVLRDVPNATTVAGVPARVLADE